MDRRGIWPRRYGIGRPERHFPTVNPVLSSVEIRQANNYPDYRDRAIKVTNIQIKLEKIMDKNTACRIK